MMILEPPKTLTPHTHEGEILKKRRTMGELSNDYYFRKFPYSQKGKAVFRSCDLPDRTIELSYDTLFLILSFLPMKEAVQTSILSRRWKNLWKSRNIINFDADEILGICSHVSKCPGKDEPSTSEQFDEFVRLIDHYFEHNSGSEIKNLRIHIRSRFHYCHMERWLHMANNMNVEKINLDFRGTNPRERYEVVISGKVSNVKHFSLSHCLMSIHPDFDGFNSLVSISLENVMIFDNFITYCPQLEQLTLVNCRGLADLRIECPPNNLKYVKVVNSASILEIYAKNLVHFECSGFNEAFLYPIVDEDGDFYPSGIMGFPDQKFLNPKFAPAKCIFTPDPNFGGFKFLQVLVLLEVNFTSTHLKYLLANCSSLAELTIEDCSFLLSSCTLMISGLPHLQTLKVLKCHGTEKIVVCATYLKYFVFLLGNSHRHLRGSFELLDGDGNHFSPVHGEGSLDSLLKHLHLRSSIFSLDMSSFMALETIILEDMYLRDEDIGDLMSNCLLVERLSLVGCHGFFTLDVAGSFLRLKYLRVICCKQLKEIGIYAANLTEFIYHGPMVCFSLKEVPQLVKVEMKVEANNYGNGINHVLSVLSEDVPKLHTLIFHIEDEKVPEALPTFCNVRHLVLIFGQQPHKLSWALLFLVASPFLENLQVQLPCNFSNAAGKKIAFHEMWTHHHLKEVELFGFSGLKKEIKFATFLLQDANALELLKIDPRQNNTSRFPLDWLQSGRKKTLQLLRKEVRLGVKLVVA